MDFDITAPRFTNEDAAREYLEARRWPKGPICPHCGAVSERVSKLEGEAHRKGLYQCNECHGQFSVTVGTLYERSHIPLHKWLLATHLMTASKKGISAHQLHRMLGITYKSAWFMAHRIREALAPHPSAKGPLGGSGVVVESDETYIGGKERNKHASKRDPNPKGKGDKEIVLSLVERKGRVRSHHVPNVTAATLRPILNEQLKRGTRLMTDDGVWNKSAASHFRHHETVNHRIGEYVRGNVHTNTIESYFAIMKRGITGVYHHVSAKHLKRYLAEFDFRYNERIALGVDDKTRADRALDGIAGKRLTYRRTSKQSETPDAV